VRNWGPSSQTVPLPMQSHLALHSRFTVFIRTPDYFVFPYLTKNFPRLENFIVCLMEQFA
jgi:hypothetical protein